MRASKSCPSFDKKFHPMPPSRRTEASAFRVALTPVMSTPQIFSSRRLWVASSPPMSAASMSCALEAFATWPYPKVNTDVSFCGATSQRRGPKPITIAGRNFMNDFSGRASFCGNARRGFCQFSSRKFVFTICHQKSSPIKVTRNSQWYSSGV